jgi:uncharacterized YigZ family protein
VISENPSSMKNESEKNFDSFVSIEKTREKVTIQRSIFISTAEHAENIDKAKSFISAVSKEFNAANHNCWAYKIGEFELCSDSGEPSGTAGKPILNAIKSSNLDRIVVVVTRYFGGIKLGTRGLIDAYGYATKIVIENAAKKRFLEGRIVEIQCKYDEFDKVRYKFKKSGYFYVSPPAFGENVKIKLFIPEDEKIDLSHLEVGKTEIEQEKLIKI